MADVRLIDATALQNTISEWRKKEMENDNSITGPAIIDAFSDVLDAISTAPTIDADPQWVSVKDRLPGEDKDEYDDDRGDVRFIRCEVCVFTWHEYHGIYPVFEPDYSEHSYVDYAFYDTEQKIFEVGDDKYHLNAMLDCEQMDSKDGMTVTYWRRIPEPPEVTK